jgi:hypothetical protein
METRNITLSLPKAPLLKVERIAVQRQTSVSELLTQTLERLIEQEDACAHALRCHPAWLGWETDLGTGGQVSTRREELHERA